MKKGTDTVPVVFSFKKCPYGMIQFFAFAIGEKTPPPHEKPP
jgi:hypothetical protein